MPEMLRRWMWRVFANITLGIWLLASPATRGYRSTAMVWSDVTPYPLNMMVTFVLDD